MRNLIWSPTLNCESAPEGKKLPRPPMQFVAKSPSAVAVEVKGIAKFQVDTFDITPALLASDESIGVYDW